MPDPNFVSLPDYRRSLNYNQSFVIIQPDGDKFVDKDETNQYCDCNCLEINGTYKKYEEVKD